MDFNYFCPNYNLYTLQGASQGSNEQCSMSPQPTGGNYHGMCRPHGGSAEHVSPPVVLSLSIKVINPTKKTESKMVYSKEH